MSAVSSASSGTNQQWQLLQQLRASRAAETAAANGSATPTGATSASPASALLQTPAASQSGVTQSGTGTTATASAPSGIFDVVATKLMSGMQSFLVNMQSDTGSGSGTGSAASASGYGQAAKSLTSGLSV